MKYLISIIFVSMIAPSVNGILISTDPNDIKFYLLPKTGNSTYREEIVYTDVVSLSKSSFRRGILTVFMVHGFLVDSTRGGFLSVINAYANSGFDANFIAVDWGKLAGMLLIGIDIPELYLGAVTNVPAVGHRMANFIEWLSYQGVLNLNLVHLVGHSLGAHAIGECGDYIQRANGGVKVPRITGLDPAGPLFWPPIKARNIDRGDAYFVDVIHTNAYFFGDKVLDGHVDFFPNGGENQPGCNFITNFLSCSHTYSEVLYAASFKIPFYACQCSKRELESYNFQICMSQCPNRIPVGVYTPHTARGEYYLVTGPLSP